MEGNKRIKEAARESHGGQRGAAVRRVFRCFLLTFNWAAASLWSRDEPKGTDGRAGPFQIPQAFLSSFEIRLLCHLNTLDGLLLTRLNSQIKQTRVSLAHLRPDETRVTVKPSWFRHYAPSFPIF